MNLPSRAMLGAPVERPDILPPKLPPASADGWGSMARLLKPIDAGYAALTADPDAAPQEPLVFDITDWRFELGSLGKKRGSLKFDPAVCGFDPVSMGFVAGWTENLG